MQLRKLSLLIAAALFSGALLPNLAGGETVAAPQVTRIQAMERMMERQKARAEQRVARLRAQSDALAAAIDPWAHSQRQAFRAHSEAVRQAMLARSDFDRALFEQHRRWLDPYADARRDWFERQMEQQIRAAEAHQNWIEQQMQAQSDWLQQQATLAPVAYPHFGW